MRSEDRRRLMRRLAAALALISFTAVAAATEPAGAQGAATKWGVDPTASPRLVGPTPPTEPEPAEPAAKWVVDDIRQMRAYPEQPPVIPHAIEGYQLTIHANRCLSCHRREFTEGSGAPMISVTHYQTRAGQMLADVSPRRYFCTVCHVPQADVAPLVDNTFVDMSAMGVRPAGSE